MQETMHAYIIERIGLHLLNLHEPQYKYFQHTPFICILSFPNFFFTS